MKAKLAKLIDVKSIMTLLLTVVFCVLALTKVITGQEFLTIFTVIVGFYFGTQSQKAPDKRTGGSADPAVTELPPGCQMQETGNEMEPEASMDTLQPPDKMEPVGFKY